MNQYPSGNIALADRPARSLREDIASVSTKFGLVLLGLDILALSLAAIAASVTTLFLQDSLGRPLYTSMANAVAERHNIFMVLGLVQLTMFWSKGLYSQRTPWWSQVQYIGKVTVLILLIDGFLSAALKIYESRLLIGFSWAYAFAFTLSLRWTASMVVSRLGWWSIPTVVIGDNNTVTDLMYAFCSDQSAGHKVHTIFLRDRTDTSDFDITNLPRACRQVQVRDGSSNAYELYIRNNPDYFYVVALDAFRGETRDQLMKVLEQAGAAYAIVPSISNVGVYDLEPRFFFGHDVMLLQPRKQVKSNAAFSIGRMIKRAMDIVIAAIALTMLLPLFVIVCTMLKLEGQGGTPLYNGKRIGYRGRKFSCWKFRSMEPNSDHLLHAHLDACPEARAKWEKYRKLENDPRVTTRTARIIRKSSIDELPQLWNVLVGDMSLVGPRPILKEETSYFSNTLKEYLSVRPGLTGLWQVSGRNATSFARRVHWDSWYVRNWSLWGDIVILIKTPIVLLSRKGAS